MTSDYSITQEKVDKLEREKLVAETAKIPWMELQVFFTRGMVVYVSEQLDLIDVALELSRDNADQLKQWIDSGELLRNFDEQAKVWSSSNALVWCVVVKPWVLVQPLPDERVLN